MTTAAMPETLHQIGAAIPGDLAGRLDPIGLSVEEPRVPEGQRPTQVERPFQLVSPVRLMNRLNAVHKVVEESLHIRIRHLGVRRIGHGRIEAPTVSRYPETHGIVELRQSVIANAGFLVRRAVSDAE